MGWKVVAVGAVVTRGQANGAAAGGDLGEYRVLHRRRTGRLEATYRGPWLALLTDAARSLDLVSESIDASRRGWVRTGMWGAVLVLAVAFALIARGVLLHHVFAFDAPVLAWLHGHESPTWTALARVLTRVGDPTTVGVATALVLAALLAARRLRDALTLAVEVGGAAVLDLAGKQFFARPRPALYPHLVHETDFGFPSGHAMGDVAFFLALFLLAERIAPGRWRSAGLMGVALAFIIGASRPYLQVHFPTDVLAGWALGLAWTITVDLLVAPAPAPRVARGGWDEPGSSAGRSRRPPG